MNKLEQILKLKKELDKKRPFSQSVLKRIKENYLIKNTYNSNAIEGNTLTEMETRVIIETCFAVGKKTLIEHLEARNHAEAIKYIESLKDESLSQSHIKAIHSILFDGIDRLNAGKFRNTDVKIAGSTHAVTPYALVPEKMTELLDWYKEETPTIDRVIQFTCKFINIHPFIDGNGRTSRLLTNLELLKLGYPPITILAIDRLEYYQALDKSYYGDYGSAYDFFYDNIIKALEEYLRYTE